MPVNDDHPVWERMRNTAARRKREMRQRRDVRKALNRIAAPWCPICEKCHWSEQGHQY